MNRFVMPLLLVCCSILSVSNAHEVRGQDTTRPPNFVILFSDDAGYSDFGFQPTVQEDMRSLTPAIDSIAARGLRCSQAYMTGCVCSPSRAGLFTGRYQNRFGFDNNLPPGTRDGLELGETFLPVRLKTLGYTTGLVGKWHLGYPSAFHPNERGFDWFYGCLQGSRSYFPIERPSPHRVILENDQPTDEQGYVTDRLGDAAVRFINTHRATPFFLFVSFTAPHGPLQAKPEDLETLATITPPRRRKYAGLVKALDDNVAKILAALEDAGVEDQTLVLFTNDNGGQTQTGAVNLPLRARKGTLYEGGVRVPWAVRWPGVVPPGQVCDTPVSALDLMPTLIEAAGGTVDPNWNLDGQSLLELFRAPESPLPDRTLFWRKGGKGGPLAVRDQDWKLIHRRHEPGAEPELYRLSEDLAESSDVAQQFPEITAELLEKGTEWEKQMVAPRWGPGREKFSNRN